MMRTVSTSLFRFASSFPKFVNQDIKSNRLLRVIHSSEAPKLIPEAHAKDFKDNNRVQYEENGVKTKIISEKLVTKGLKIQKNSALEFSEGIQKQHNFVGIASEVLSSAFKFSRKEKEPEQVTLGLSEFRDKEYIMEMTSAKIRAKEWANCRGNEGTPQFFEDYCTKLSKELPIKMTIIKGQQLLDHGFRLMHAVGRASLNEPRFINLSYEGNPGSKQWIAFVGKGVCFDAGGLNLKPSTGIKDMHMDKHGSASTLSAFESAVRLGLKVNLTVSLGYVQNFINENAYRPNDIIKSRKGLCVQIGNTDAEGRLVLADCMSWTQENYKVKNMIELSTLTGAIIISLGKKRAGLFSNSDVLSEKLMKSGNQIGEFAWRMPIDEYHHDIIKSKHADISNAPGKPEGSSCQAAAFLERFVENDVNWIHLDIAGTAHIQGEATGYGSRLLVNYLKNHV